MQNWAHPYRNTANNNWVYRVCVCVFVCSAGVYVCSAGPKSADKLAFSWTHLLTTAPGTPAVNGAALQPAKNTWTI